jgi:hypothetical protein
MPAIFTPPAAENFEYRRYPVLFAAGPDKYLPIISPVLMQGLSIELGVNEEDDEYFEEEEEEHIAAGSPGRRMAPERKAMVVAAAAKKTGAKRKQEEMTTGTSDILAPQTPSTPAGGAKKKIGFFTFTGENSARDQLEASTWLWTTKVKCTTNVNGSPLCDNLKIATEYVVLAKEKAGTSGYEWMKDVSETPIVTVKNAVSSRLQCLKKNLSTEPFKANPWVAPELRNSPPSE